MVNTTKQNSIRDWFTSVLWIIFMIPMSLIARVILFSMGWSLIDPKFFDKVTKRDRSVLIFSHTSYADFYIMALYLLSYPRRLHHVRTLIKPQPFQYAGSLLTSLGAIPATKLEDKNGGAVNRIVSELKKWDKCLFLISPKGTIVKSEWRSGYYHIAQQLNANLMAAGLDYERKCIIVCDDIDYNNSEAVISNFLQEQLKDIVPLFPDDEVVTIRPHETNKRGVVDYNRLLSVTMGLVSGFLIGRLTLVAL